MELLDITVYHLEMWTPPRLPELHQADKLNVRHIQSPAVPYYRSLYNQVGEKYHWLSRRKMSDEQLASIIDNPLNELHVLYVGESPAGFA